MANRQQAAPVPARARSGDGNTARVVVHKSTLPGWFWGMVGCLSVLAIGFGALLLVAKNGVLDGHAAAVAEPATAAVVPSAAPAGPGGPQIEQLAAPPPPPPAAPPPHPHAAGHPIKLARSPLGGHVAAPAAQPEAPAKSETAAAEDAPAAKKPAATPAANDDDQTVHIHHATASDSDDDDDDDN